MTKTILDSHIHIIPGVDDGATDIDIAMEMIEKSKSQGTKNIIATSHSYAFDINAQKANESFLKLQQECLSKGIGLYMGCEILCQPHKIKEIIHDINTEKYPSMNKTKYILMEWDNYNAQIEKLNKCIDLFVENGWKPIIAHAERYFFSSVELVKQWILHGALIQMNLYSVADEEDMCIRGLARALLKEKLVSIIGTDAHGINHRAPMIDNGVKEMYSFLDEAYVDAILFKNAMQMFGIS